MKKTAKPNIRPDWMKKSPKVSKEYAEKRAQIVQEWDTWPKATEAHARRADQRLAAVFNRTGRNDEKRVRTLQKIEAMDIPARLKPEVARLREYLGSGIHDPIAIITLEMFFLGVELQSLDPELRKQIAGRKSGANRIKKDADERYEYARAQFAAIKKEGLISPRYRIVAEAIKRTRAKFGIKPKLFKGRKETTIVTWPNKATKGRIFKGMK